MHIKLVQVGSSTDIMHGPFVGLKTLLKFKCSYTGNLQYT